MINMHMRQFSCKSWNKRDEPHEGKNFISEVILVVTNIVTRLFSYKLANVRDQTRTIIRFTQVLSRVLQNIHKTDAERISGRFCLCMRLISSRN